MIWNSLRFFICLVGLTGIIYPLLITLIAQLTMNENANGGLITTEKGRVGARLIAQKFTEERYFWPRPSAIDYNPLASGGSNLGPTSASLKEMVSQRRQQLIKSSEGKEESVPPELLLSSGSGLDPDLSVTAASFQVARIAKARSIDQEQVQQVLEQLQIRPRVPWVSHAYVNVLQLNLALDSLSPTVKPSTTSLPQSGKKS